MSFRNFRKQGGSDFSRKKGGVVEIGMVVLKMGGVLLIVILINTFQCYLSLIVWCLSVYVYMFCLYVPFLLVLFVFHRKNLVF